MDAARYTVREEIANSITGGVGVILAIAALAVLLTHALLWGDVWHVVTCAIFGATLIISYITSTLYHSISMPRFKPLLRALDHSAIFLLIAGTYTPFLLVNLRGVWGWSLFAVIWAVAIVGVILRLMLKGRYHGLVVSLYITMGWAVVVAIKPLLEHLQPGGLILLASGGDVYTVGIAFYTWRKLPYSHAVWHLFVLGGSALHFFAILLYVLP
jgi:hemolysin III